jgi:hypothetical protein
MQRILLVLCALVTVRGNQCIFSNCGDDGCVKNQCCGLVGGACCSDREINENQACGDTPGICKERVCMSGRCRERNANAGTQCVFTPPLGVCELQATCDGNGNCIKPNVLVSPGVQCSTSTCSGTCSGASNECVCSTPTPPTIVVPATVLSLTTTLTTTTLTPMSASPTVTTATQAQSSLSSSTAVGAATIPEEATDTESETDSAPPDMASGAMPWLVPLLIALGVVCLLVALAAAFFVARKRRAAAAPAAQSRSVSLGSYPAPEFKSARNDEPVIYDNAPPIGRTSIYGGAPLSEAPQKDSPPIVYSSAPPLSDQNSSVYGAAPSTEPQPQEASRASYMNPADRARVSNVYEAPDSPLF